MTNLQLQYENQRLEEKNKKLALHYKCLVRDFLVAGLVFLGMAMVAVMSVAEAAPAYENKELAPKTFSVTCYENVLRKGKVVCVSAEADLLNDAVIYKMGNS